MQVEDERVNNQEEKDHLSDDLDDEEYDDDPTDGWDRKVQMLQSELAGDSVDSGSKQTRASRVKANRAFQEMLKNKSPSKNSNKKSLVGLKIPDLCADFFLHVGFQLTRLAGQCTLHYCYVLVHFIFFMS